MLAATGVTVVPLALLGTLVFTFVNFLKYVSGRQWNSAFTQITAWTAGIVAVQLFAHTAYAAAVDFGGHTLGGMNFWSQLLIGLMATSLLSTVNEGYKALDGTQSASKPRLFHWTLQRQPEPQTGPQQSAPPPPP